MKVFQNASCHLLKGIILSFSNTILLRDVRDHKLPLDFVFGTIIIKLIAIILTPIVKSQHLDFEVRMIFNQEFEIFEPIKGLILLL